MTVKMNIPIARTDLLDNEIQSVLEPLKKRMACSRAKGSRI